MASSANSTSSDLGKAIPPTVFRTPAWSRYLSLFAAVLIAVIAAATIALAIVLLFGGTWGLGIFIAAVGIFMAALDGYVMRDLRGRWGLRVELLPDRMILDLPGGRSLIHRPSSQHLTIPYDDVEAVETRLEAFPSLGMMSLQRAFVLSLKPGDRIFLFEDRALATGFAPCMYEPMAAAIVERAHVPLRDLGMVEGGGGVLSVWGAHAPDWAAPSLPLAQQIRIWRHAASTGSFAIAIIMLAFMIRAAVH